MCSSDPVVTFDSNLEYLAAMGCNNFMQNGRILIENLG